MKKVSNYKYSWSRHFGVSAQVFGEVYYSLKKRTPEELLAVARKRSSPLHRLFEWNDHRAAHQHRLVQARIMVNSLQVDIMTPKGKTATVVAFIRSSRHGRPHIATPEASSEEVNGAMQECWREMLRFRRLYKNLEIASTVVAAINEVDRRLRRSARLKAA